MVAVVVVVAAAVAVVVAVVLAYTCIELSGRLFSRQHDVLHNPF